MANKPWAIRFEDGHPNADCDNCGSREHVLKIVRYVPEMARTDREYVLGAYWLCAKCLREAAEIVEK